MSPIINPSFVDDKKIYDLSETNDRDDIFQLINALTENQTLEKNSFFVADLDEIYRRHVEWQQIFPRVEPLYAVKSNYDVNVIKLLSFLGTGFDCSSQGEIEKILKLNISPDRILFANPCKLISEIKFSEKCGVKTLVFDNEYELVKIKQNHPNAECFLRIKVNSLPAKFGADMNTSIKLIKKAIDLNIKLNGISFYVGFRQENACSIIESIKNARYLFDYARENFGYIMNCLDIGGGFPGTWQTKGLVFEMAHNINLVLDQYFPSDLFDDFRKDSSKFKIIAELGTYYTCAAYTLCVHVMAKREIEPDENINTDYIFLNGKNNKETINKCNLISRIDTKKAFIYYINDSIHASFKWYTIKEGSPVFMSSYKKTLNDNKYFKSSIAGSTCDSSDFILKNIYMPELEIGEYLIFRNMGSYTKTCAVAFNEIPLPKTIFISSNLWNLIKDAFQDEIKG